MTTEQEATCAALECSACGSNTPVVRFTAVPEKGFPGGYLCGTCRHRSWSDLNDRIARRSAQPPAAEVELAAGQRWRSKNDGRRVEIERFEMGRDGQLVLREWDSDKYNGLDAATYRQLSNLDKRIADAKELLATPMKEPRFPPFGRSCRVYRSNG